MKLSVPVKAFCAAALLPLLCVVLSGCNNGIETGIPSDTGANAAPTLPPEPSGSDMKEIAKRK